MWPLPFDDGRSFDPRARPTSSPDVELACQVLIRILADPQLGDERINVEVQNRVVNLFGTVSSLYARVTAADMARSTPGVADICNRLQLPRSTDVTDDVEDLRLDPFDELVAHWDDVQEQPEPIQHDRPVAGMLDVAAMLVALIAAVLWVVLLPRFGGAGLLVVLPCVTAAVALASRAGQRQAPADGGDATPPGRQTSS